MSAVLVAGAAALLVGFAGGLATRTDAWYRALRQPAWKPPDWAFGPIWATILALAAGAAALGWAASPATADRLLLVWAFGLNAALNVAWSVIFFRLRRPDWALAEVGLLWLSVLLLALVLARVSGLAAALVLPYLAWVGVAGLLNLTIVRLNPAPSGIGRA
ncbi:sensory protein TspO [Methylobacterium gregans]|uniref:TspO/MBR family protein n=1 Tax=Methylobacterium gregans TaxID=374424 RepID=UPI00235DB778|nr:TspO/MBR family protein [Methylobacterium gregans]MDQ0521178.1 tryptophan-rich sensory protein [Methylobacterium gregans]GLS54344.1 sensory protein TspO [Methylobacterium gregans]